MQSFTFRSINQKYQKYYFTVYPSLSDLTLQITVKGLTTPLSRWVQVGVCLCRYSLTCALSPTGLVPWFSKAKGNTYSTLLHHPFLFKGKTNASSRSSTPHPQTNHSDKHIWIVLSAFSLQGKKHKLKR